jgi:hypothetical protein
MKKTTRNVLLGTLGAGLFALATTPVTVHAGHGRRIGAWIDSGLGVVSTVNGFLNEREEETQEYWLQRGVQYAFAATCDNDCTDIDLKLFNRSGQRQVADTDSDPYPQVVFTPPASGTYRLRVVMFRCRIEPCRYDVDQYRR